MDSARKSLPSRLQSANGFNVPAEKQNFNTQANSISNLDKLLFLCLFMPNQTIADVRKYLTIILH